MNETINCIILSLIGTGLAFNGQIYDITFSCANDSFILRSNSCIKVVKTLRLLINTNAFPRSVFLVNK